MTDQDNKNIEYLNYLADTIMELQNNLRIANNDSQNKMYDLAKFTFPIVVGVGSIFFLPAIHSMIAIIKQQLLFGFVSFITIICIIYGVAVLSSAVSILAYAGSYAISFKKIIKTLKNVMSLKR
jgi:hypothetical protein